LLDQHRLWQFLIDFYSFGFVEQIIPCIVAACLILLLRFFTPDLLGCLKQTFVFLLQARVVVGESFSEVPKILAFKSIPLLHASLAQPASLLLCRRRLFVHALAKLGDAFFLGLDLSFY